LNLAGVESHNGRCRCSGGVRTRNSRSNTSFAAMNSGVSNLPLDRVRLRSSIAKPPSPARRLDAPDARGLRSTLALDPREIPMLLRTLATILLLMPIVAWGADAAPGTPVVSPEALARDPRVVQALRLLEAWADTETVEKRLPGVSMAVVHDQQLLWSRGFGYAQLEPKIAARGDTMYSICSISKLFTSIAVMQQRDAGKLDLDDPVATHLPIAQAAEPPPQTTADGLKLAKDTKAGLVCFEPGAESSHTVKDKAGQ
jgi:hypothetical protein